MQEGCPAGQLGIGVASSAAVEQTARRGVDEMLQPGAVPPLGDIHPSHFQLLVTLTSPHLISVVTAGVFPQYMLKTLLDLISERHCFYSVFS